MFVLNYWLREFLLSAFASLFELRCEPKQLMLLYYKICPCYCCQAVRIGRALLSPFPNCKKVYRYIFNEQSYDISFQILSARGSAAEQNEIFEFFKDLVDVLMESGDVNSRLDFLACPLSANNEGMQVVRNLEEFIKVWFLFYTAIALSKVPFLFSFIFILHFSYTVANIGFKCLKSWV